jgi:hypothetical protein
VRILIIIVWFFCFSPSINGQEVFVYNSSGGSSSNSDFVVISSFAEPITSIGSNVENGFLSFKKYPINLSQKNITENNQVKIYPSSTEDFLYVESFQLFELIVYNGVGQKIETHSINVGVNRINISKYSTGIYYLKLNNDFENVPSFKIIKN